MWVLATGPGGEGPDAASSYRPYAWLLSLPGFSGLRVPARFAMVGTLCLAMSACLAVAFCARLSLFAGDRSGWSRHARVLGGAAVIAGLLADGMTGPVPVVQAPGKVLLPGSAQTAVIELPLDNTVVSIEAMYRSIFHRQPLVNGYSGHFPPHYRALSLSLWRGDVSGLLYLARRRPLAIIVNDRLDPGRGFEQMIEEIPGIQSHGVSGAGSIFLLPAQPAPREPPAEPPLQTTVRDAGRDVLEFDVGKPHLLSAIAIPVRRRYEEFAARLRIETSEDGTTWQESWLGWTGGMLVEAMLSDPSVAPVRIPIAGVKARYVRVYPASEWMRTEVQVLGR